MWKATGRTVAEISGTTSRTTNIGSSDSMEHIFKLTETKHRLMELKGTKHRHTEDAALKRMMNTTTVQPRPSPSLDSRELRDFLCNEARRSGYSEDQVRQALTDDYGCPERGMRTIQAALAEDEAIMAREFPPGREPIKLGRKPNTGEQVTFAQLRENLWIRVWGGDLDHCFHFDFVNGERRYMRTPSDVEIYAEAIGGNPGGRVLSIEASIEAAKARSSELAVSMRGARDDSQVDPDWETYVILEGTRLRIKQSHQPDRFLSILVRTPQEANLVLQPWQ